MLKIDAIRNEIMQAFNGATDINSIRINDSFNNREIVAAIDITDDPFTVSFWLDRDKETRSQIIHG